jgi:hypothetical protein
MRKQYSSQRLHGFGSPFTGTGGVDASLNAGFREARLRRRRSGSIDLQGPQHRQVLGPGGCDAYSSEMTPLRRRWITQRDNRAQSEMTTEYRQKQMRRRTLSAKPYMVGSIRLQRVHWWCGYACSLVIGKLRLNRSETLLCTTFLLRMHRRDSALIS